MPLKVYYLPTCQTCRKALKFLDEHNIEYKLINIRENPPKKTEIRKMLAAFNGEPKRLFNTSSKDYKNLDLKNKVREMDTGEIVDLLASNGNLVRRPFVVHEDVMLVGYIRQVWEAKLLD